MEWEDLKNKSKAELNELLAETGYELHGLSFQAHNRQLKQVHKIKLLKKTVARISALLRSKELGDKSGTQSLKSKV